MGIFSKFRSPTWKQLELAEKLGIKGVITPEMSSRQVGRIISQVITDIEEARAKALQVKDLQERRKALRNLIKNGLAVGSTVQVGEHVNLVIGIDMDAGSVDYYTKGGRILIDRNPMYIVNKIAPDSQLNDAWGKRIKEIQDKDAENAVKLEERLQKRKMAKEERQQKHLAYRTSHDQRFCIQCGQKMHRPEDCSLISWSKVRRCSVCSKSPQALSWRYCLSCGSRFKRDPDKAGASRANCVSCS